MYGDRKVGVLWSFNGAKLGLGPTSGIYGILNYATNKIIEVIRNK